MPGISALYILDLKGKVLIYRVYRDLVPNGSESAAVSSHSIIEKFTLLLNEREDESTASSAPVLPIPPSSVAEGEMATDGGSFLWLKLPSLYIVALVPPSTPFSSVNAVLVFTFLHKIVAIFTEYFRELEEESIRDNFVLIYELLDEICDWGMSVFVCLLVRLTHLCPDTLFLMYRTSSNYGHKDPAGVHHTGGA